MDNKKKDMTAKVVDEKLTEQDALQRAAAQGIYFVDSFIIVSNDTLQKADDKRYKTEDDAKKALSKLENPDQYHVQQVRERKS